MTTRWSSISGDAGDLLDVGDRDAGVGERRRGAAARHQLAAELVQAAGELDEAGLVVDRQQRAHQLTVLLLVATSSPEHLRVEAALDVLDPLVQRLDGVVGEDRHGLLGEDRAVVDLERREVHRAAGDLDARRRARPRPRASP